MSSSRPLQQYLADSALAEILERAAPILGRNDGSSSSPTCDWMARVPDETKLVDMNLPGTHDAATWDYSDARQAELIKYTGPIREAVFFRCQERSLLQSLNDGIRVFDLRLGYNPGNDTIGFYHGVAMLGPTTTLQDVLYGLYNWLIAHPSETILVSINQEAGPNTLYDKKFEEILFATLNNELGKKFWLPVTGELGTLGAARGKLVLLQRFTYQFLSAPANPFGIHLDAEQWTDNGGNIELVYTKAPKRVAYIQDTYKPLVPSGSSADANIRSKFEAVTGHLMKAINDLSDGQVDEALYVCFVSAHKNSDRITPNIIALGDASTTGMNERLLPWVSQHKGKRFGIVLLDFYHSQPGLVEAIIGL
ncbi:PLC-like phosphodiesterase [Mycena sanguinolenta]|uniref:PLC-like phosphodiesterase n=1 Tax=Mycena sanguinolenta TaxID=230812 RepID=A0A8H6ZIH5_9AGAR|nr:PLC-like phosphodiesterase [Mycena sanguinolenta]